VDREQGPTPLDYAAVNAAYATLLAAAVARRRERELERFAGAELVPLGLATFAIAKTIAHERIGVWVREPFVEEEGGKRRPRGRRLRRVVGELVTCTRCVGAWSALGLVGLRIAAPTAGRTVTDVFAVAALNDFLQAGFRALCEEVNARSSAR
jgi:hypothetical protein